MIAFILVNRSLLLLPGVERDINHLGVHLPLLVSIYHEALIKLVNARLSSISINYSVIDKFLPVLLIINKVRVGAKT